MLPGCASMAGQRPDVPLMIAGRSTRMEVLELLRRKGRCSAETVASDLGVTPNAVRQHLSNLEREGFVVSHPERSGREPHREGESDGISAHFLADRAFCVVGFGSSWAVHTDVRACIEIVFAAHGSNSRGRVPTRYTKLKIPTQMMSRACQKRLKHRNRWRMSRRNPFA